MTTELETLVEKAKGCNPQFAKLFFDVWSAGKITTQQYTDLLLQIIEQQEAKQ